MYVYREPVKRYATRKSLPPAAKLTRSLTLPPLTDSKSTGLNNKTTSEGKKEKPFKSNLKKTTKSISAKERLTVKIDCPAAVSKLLIQKLSHQQDLSISQSEGFGLSGVDDGGREEKEANFLRRVDQIAKEERANRLRWY